MTSGETARGRWRLGAVAVGAAFALRAGMAHGQTNYQSYPVGGRAAGMGGAYTALADDAPGAYYNPAGIAFAEGDSLSLSASLYGMVGGSQTAALGPGLDYTYSSVNLVPSAASSVLHIGHGTATQPSPWVFGFNVFAPQNLSINQPTTANNGLTTLFNTTEETTLLIGPTLAWRMNSRLSLGVSLEGIYHQFTRGLDFTDTFPSGMGAVMDFVQATSNLSQTDLGMVVAAGVRARLDDDVYVGLTVRSPSVEFYGSGKTFNRAVAAATTAGMAPRILARSADVSTEFIMPLRVGLGMAWSRPGRFTLSLDTTLYAPVHYTQVTSASSIMSDIAVDHGTVLDVAVGMEICIKPTVPFMVGFFTDFSAAPSPSPTGSSEDQVNLVGATLGVGWKSAHTSTLVGLIGDYGWTRNLGVDIVSGSYQTFATTGTQWRAYLNYAGTYSF